MAGRYAKKETLYEPLDVIKTKSAIPSRATRHLPALQNPEIEEVEEEDIETQEHQLDILRFKMSLAFDKVRSIVIPPKPLRFIPSTTPAPVSTYRTPKVVPEFAVSPLERHKPWIYRFVITALVVVIALGVLLSAAILQRPGDAQLINLPGFGKVYDVQVGGSLAGQVQQTNGPITPKVPLQTGPYSVLGAPSVNADFINRVLDAYGSPAAGKGQALYDMGVKYGIDPAFALAFFQHESSFGKAGEARSSLSLGNLRCIPDAQCTDNYAWFPTWEAGFEAWYKLIRNLYVAVWGLTTVDQIIPRYAPTADNNNEAAYIAALKRELDAWHAGQIYT
ncbi:MAG: hypothetical protein NVSMB38_26390 [Ktedonobacteraceae bacterium]